MQQLSLRSGQAFHESLIRLVPGLDHRLNNGPAPIREVDARDPGILGVVCPPHDTIALESQESLGDRGCVNPQGLRQPPLRDPFLDRQPVDDMILADMNADRIEGRGYVVPMSAADLRQKQAYSGVPGCRPASGRYLVSQLSFMLPERLARVKREPAPSGYALPAPPSREGELWPSARTFGTPARS